MADMPRRRQAQEWIIDWDCANTCMVGYASKRLEEIRREGMELAGPPHAVVTSRAEFSEQNPSCCHRVPGSLISGDLANLDFASHSAANLRNFSERFIGSLLSPLSASET
jgi:hypothetical protein